MKYCPRCGVVLSDGADLCPLCGSPSTDRAPSSADAGGVVFPSSARTPRPPRGNRPVAVGPVPATEKGGAESAETSDDLSVAERGRVAVELLSVGLGIALVVTLLVDLFVERGFGWSRYSSLGIAAAWLFSAMPLILRGRPWILYAVLAPSTPLLVFLLDAVDGRFTWFLPFGAPIALLAIGCVAAVGGISVALRRKGLNLLAVALGGIAVFCAGLEAVIDLNLNGRLAFDWSAVVAFALVPSGGLLFYLHYRIVHRASLRKLFRL